MTELPFQTHKRMLFFFFGGPNLPPDFYSEARGGSSSLLCGADGLERGKEQIIFVNILYLVTTGGGTEWGCGRVVALVLAEAV